MPLEELDHDLLIRIDEKLNLLVKSFYSHKEENEKSFETVNERFEGNENRIDSLDRKVAAVFGGLTVLQFILFAVLKFWH